MSKTPISLAVLGDTQSGKSTIIGQLLLQLNLYSKREAEIDEKDAVEREKPSMRLAFIVDKQQEERENGYSTVASSHGPLEAKGFQVTLINLPGNPDLLAVTKEGARSADGAILVISAVRGEFESSIRRAGMAREHANIAKGLRYKGLIVAVNKMDMEDYSQERYEEIVKEMGDQLQRVGFNKSKINFVTISGYKGDNLTEKSDRLSWYKGDTLLQAIEKIEL